MQTNSRRLSIESLEKREVCAANVNAFVDSAGILQLTGDNNANSIEVYGTGNHNFVVKGMGAGQTVNGSSNAQSFHAASDKIFGNLNGGDDYIYMHDASVNQIRMTFGAGSDDIYIKNVNANSTLDSIYLDMGTDTSKDYVYLENDHISGNLSAYMGAGDDYLSFKNVHIDNLLNVDGGAGTDSYSWSNSSYHKLAQWTSIEKYV